MNQHQIAFIISVNDIAEAQECLRYINRLKVPEEYEIDILTIQEAPSMAEAYDAAMKASEAKYKIYLHQDVFLIYRDMLQDMLDIFKSDEEIGLMGCVGASRMPENAVAGMAWDTGKILQNQVPQKAEYKWESENRYQEVDAVDGLFIATQYDIEWRKDIFDGWDFYDISQCYEMKRRQKKVVVPCQKQFWCYHDNLYSKMLDFDRYRMKFIEEYQDFGTFQIEENYNVQNNQSYEQMKIELMNQLGELLDRGEMNQLAVVFQNPQNRGYLFLREYEVVSRVYQEEQKTGQVLSLWKPGRTKDEVLEELHQLKFLLKAIEFGVPEPDTKERIKGKYSVSAVNVVTGEYCIWTDQIRDYLE